MQDPTLEGGALPGPVLERLALEAPPAVYEELEEFSLVNVVGGRLREAILAVPPEFRLMDEKTLVDFCELTPTRVDYALRTSFWREYGRAMVEGRTHLETRAVYSGVCSDAYFYQRYLTNTGKVAWLVLPQQSYVKEMEAVLCRATQRLWELIDLDLKDPKTGKVCPRRGELLLKVVAMVQDRVKGLAVQRIAKSTLTIDAGTKPGAAVPQPTLDDLRRRLDELGALDGSRDRDEVVAGDRPALPAVAQETGRAFVDVTSVRVPVDVPGGESGGGSPPLPLEA